MSIITEYILYTDRIVSVANLATVLKVQSFNFVEVYSDTFGDDTTSLESYSSVSIDDIGQIAHASHMWLSITDTVILDEFNHLIDEYNDKCADFFSVNSLSVRLGEHYQYYDCDDFHFRANTSVAFWSYGIPKDEPALLDFYNHCILIHEPLATLLTPYKSLLRVD